MFAQIVVYEHFWLCYGEGHSRDPKLLERVSLVSTQGEDLC